MRGERERRVAGMGSTQKSMRSRHPECSIANCEYEMTIQFELPAAGRPPRIGGRAEEVCTVVGYLRQPVDGRNH
jgi:hypothetical protein